MSGEAPNEAFGSDSKPWLPVTGEEEERGIPTCALQSLVQYRRSSELIVEGCSCSWYIAAVTLATAVSGEMATQYVRKFTLLLLDSDLWLCHHKLSNPLQIK